MARRIRYEDTGSLGRSKIVRYRGGESPSDRHARRLYSNLDHQKEIRAWAQRAGIVLQIFNEGHHWRFTFGTRVAEWWPSSAKLVLNRDYASGIHVHDYAQVTDFLRKEWNLIGDQR